MSVSEKKVGTVSQMELEIVRSGALVELDKISCSTRASSPPRNYLYVRMVLDEVELSYRSF